MRVRTLLLTLALCLLAGTAAAVVPNLINYQGKLTDTLGRPINNPSQPVIISIYDAPAGGMLLWAETLSVPVTDGIYNVNLGAVTPIPATLFATTPRYLSVDADGVGGDPEMTPRQQIGSVAYSLRVGTVDGATGGTISGNVTIASDLNVSGNATGNIVTGTILRSTVAAGPAPPIPFGEYYRDNAIVAWARVSAAGALLDDFGVSGVAHLGLGIYRITISFPAAAPTSLIPVASAVVFAPPIGPAAVRLIHVHLLAPNTFQVYITNGLFGFVDSDFTFIVTGR